MTIPYAGVLFDFSSTLFYIESALEATRAVGLDPAWAPRLDAGGALNGSSGPAVIPQHLQDVWARRDLSLAAHRAAYSGLAEHTGLSTSEAADLYHRGVSAAAWHPYPDTIEILTQLRRRRVPTALVSNIGWDPRTVLRNAGVLDLLGELLLSYEVGHIKPDQQIFTLACNRLNIDPARTLMVGDNRAADGAATAIGCTFAWVEPDASRRAPDTLLRAVGLV